VLLRFDRKDVPRYNMLTVTTDSDLNRHELFRSATARELYGAGSVSRAGSLQKTTAGVEAKIVSLEGFTPYGGRCN